GQHADDFGMGVLGDLPRQRLAIGRRHPVIRLNALVCVDARLKRLPAGSVFDAGGISVGRIERLCVHADLLADLPELFPAIYNKNIDLQDISVTYRSNRQSVGQAHLLPSAAARFRWFRGRQAIVPTDLTARGRFCRKASARDDPASPSATGPSATADRAAPRGGNDGSGGFAR